MSDAELSHCEQFLIGSMLTNELSSASSEISGLSGINSRKSDFLCATLQEKRQSITQLVKIIFSIPNMDFKRCGNHAVEVIMFAGCVLSSDVIQMRSPEQAKKPLTKGNTENCLM